MAQSFIVESVCSTEPTVVGGAGGIACNGDRELRELAVAGDTGEGLKILRIGDAREVRLYAQIGIQVKVVDAVDAGAERMR